MSDFDLAKEEYLTLRKEVETHMAELGLLEKNCVLASAAIYAWLAKGGDAASISAIAWYIPIFFAIFGAIRSFSLGVHLKNLGEYLFEIESAYLVDDNKPQGWEHHLKSEKKPIRSIGTSAFWIVFLISTITIGILAS